MENENQKSNKGKKVKLITPSRVAHPTKPEGADSNALTAIKPVLDKFKYPIANHDAMLKELSASNASKNEQKLAELKKSINNLPIAFFPVRSSKELTEKITELLNPDLISELRHPTAARAPLFNSKTKK